MSVGITDFHDLSRPAVIVLRDQKELLLLLTGIPARWRASGAAVYHSVAWLIDDDSDSGEERIIRRLIIHALQGNLQRDAISAITSLPDDELGFHVDFDRLKRLEADETLEVVDGKSVSNIPKVGKNIQNLKEALIDELKKNRLPPENGFLIVVSDFVAEPLFRQAKVWRGLSSRVENQNWEEDNEKKPLPTPSIPATPLKTSKSLIIFLPILIIMIILSVWINHIHIEQTGRPLFNLPSLQNQSDQSSSPMDNNQKPNPIHPK